MDLQDLFAPELSPEEFFLERVVALHEAYIDEFRDLCRVGILLSIYFRDSDKRFTLHFDIHGAESTEGEAIDFPLITLVGEENHWEKFKGHVRRILEKVSVDTINQQKPRTVVSKQLVSEFERFDGIVELSFSDEESGEIMDLQIVLNDYEVGEGSPRISVHVPLSLVSNVADESISPLKAVQSLKIQGDKAFALTLGGFFQKHM